MDSLDARARLIHKVKSELGWDGDIPTFINRIQELDKGLPSEDEFIYLLNWSGKCRFFHKLDQSLLPPRMPKHEYVVPDLLIELDTDQGRQAFLVEIKTGEKQQLSWSEPYYAGLLRYSSLLRLPVLIAWKMGNFDIWTLFRLENFEQGPRNYKITFQKAHAENLMSMLLDDYIIVPESTFDFTMSFRKDRLIGRKRNTSTWQMTIDDLYFKGKGGERFSKIGHHLFSVFLSLSADTQTRETATHVVQTYTPAENEAIYAQSVLVRLVKGSEDHEINWIERIKSDRYPIAYEKLFVALEEGKEKGLIQSYFKFMPRSWETKEGPTINIDAPG